MDSPVPGLMVERRDGVATITLNHPERANALDPTEFHELAAILRTLGAEPDLQAIVLTGQGDRAFCAGLNLRNEQAIKDDLASPGPTGLGATLRAAADLEVPLLGRINGACVAGGMGLLGACDEVIAVDNARFGLPEIRHGIFPHVALCGLRGRGTPSMLDHLARTGTTIDAGAALDAGLVDQVVSRQGLEPAVEAWVSAIRAGHRPKRFLARRDRGVADRAMRIDDAERLARDQSVQIVNS